MTSGNFNNRQTGARKFEPHPEEVDRDRVDLDAAENRPPSRLMRDVDETVAKTRQSDAVDQAPRPSGTGRAIQPSAGTAGPAARRPAKPE